jgi:hypothetical protein
MPINAVEATDCRGNFLRGDFYHEEHEEHEVRKNPTGRYFFVSFVLFVVRIGLSLATP